jgi:hypothetical protein
MGQRLNVEIKENGEVLANAYYHWSGYTSSSLEITEFILTQIDKTNYENRIINAIKLLEATGAGLTKDEKEFGLKYIDKFNEYEFINATDRNDGLLAISPKGIEETEQWEEARVEINLYTKTINFGAVWTETKEEYIDDYSEEDYKKIPIYNTVDFKNITFENFIEVKNEISGLIDDGIYSLRFIDESKGVISFIE